MLYLFKYAYSSATRKINNLHNKDPKRFTFHFKLIFFLVLVAALENRHVVCACMNRNLTGAVPEPQTKIYGIAIFYLHWFLAGRHMISLTYEHTITMTYIFMLGSGTALWMVSVHARSNDSQPSRLSDATISTKKNI